MRGAQVVGEDHRLTDWRPPEVYQCIDCDGEAHLISFLPEDGEIEAGTPFAYRCSDCMERFDVIWGDDD